MLTQQEVWVELSEADEQLRHLVAEGAPTGKHLWQQFSPLHRRLQHDPPAGGSETVERLRAMQDECRAELERGSTVHTSSRTAPALVVAANPRASNRCIVSPIRGRLPEWVRHSAAPNDFADQLRACSCHRHLLAVRWKCLQN
ncbi:MAG: hypothetical protein ACYTAO_09030 [Planctomycetota bacterium]